MKRSFIRLTLFGFLFAIGIMASAQSQNRGRFVISVKAGGVNLVLGRVTVKRSGQRSEQPLTNQDELASGDTVYTGVGSRVEVLLTPGSYLRVGENSEFKLVDGSLDRLSLRLVKGSAIVEANGTDKDELSINISTDDASLVIVRRGLYRLNVRPGLSELLVKEGRVLIASGETVKSGQKITFTQGASSITKLQANAEDEFDSWSRERGKTLARANASLAARVRRSPLSSYRGSGLWVRDPAFSYYTFLLFDHDRSLLPHNCYFGDVGFFTGVVDLSNCSNFGRRQPATTNNPGSSGASNSVVTSGSTQVTGSSRGTGSGAGPSPSTNSTGSSPNRTGPSSPPNLPARDRDTEQRGSNRPRVP